jgi:hypothetical protein
MKVHGKYRFSGTESTTVRVTDVVWKGLRRYVNFYTLYNDKPVGSKRTILYSYAKKHWTQAD